MVQDTESALEDLVDAQVELLTVLICHVGCRDWLSTKGLTLDFAVPRNREVPPLNRDALVGPACARLAGCGE